MTPQSFVLTPKLIRQVAIVFTLLVLLGITLHFFLTNGRVVIEATGQDGSPMTLTITGAKHNKAKEIKLTQNGSRTVWLPADDYAITLTQDHRQTIGATRVRAFTKESVSLVARDEAASVKLATQSSGCGIISAGVYFSYDCYAPSQIFRHSGATSAPISGRIFSRIFALDDGFIVSARGEEGIPLAYLNPATNQLTNITLPNIVAQAEPDAFNVIVNTTSTSTYKFAVVLETSNTWFLYRSITDQSPLEVSPGKIDDARIGITYQLTGDLISIFANSKPHEEDEAVIDHSEHENNVPGEVQIYSLSSRQTKKVQLPENLSLDSFYLTSPDTAVAEVSNGGLAILEFDSDDLKFTGTIPEGSNPVIKDNRVIFSRNTSVYQYHPATGISQRLFEAQDFSMSSLNLIGNTVIMQAFTGQDSQQISGRPSAFALDLTKPATYPRPEWSLSGGSQSSKPVDYTGLEAITQYGVTTYQVDGLKYAFNLYYKSLNKNIDTVAIDIGRVSKKSLPRGSAERAELSFTVTINKQDTYQAHLQYFSVSAVRLYLSKPGDSTIVYDSQDIDIAQ